MNEKTPRTDRTHNIVLVIISVACIGSSFDSVIKGWELWVPPLILVGVISAWILHLSHRGRITSRENYYLILVMLISFYHGVHRNSLFDVTVINLLLMITVTLLVRREYLRVMVALYLILMGVQIIISLRAGDIVLDPITFSRIMVHIIAELCAYMALKEIISEAGKNIDEIDERKKEKDADRTEMEDFLVNVSHELRTPINVINGLTAIILKREAREDINSIRDAGLRLSRQIEDIQDYSEIQRGDVFLENGRYMITSLINDIISDYRIREQTKNVELVVDLDPNVPASLNGDSKKIGKIIRHLLSNAAKFTRKGGVYLRISGVRREYGYNLQIEVTDTGIGIKTADIERMSNGSYQANKKRNRSTGGIGLGLPIVYGFVRKMNGFVSIESDVGEGTTVRVCVAQEIENPQPCLSVENASKVSIAFYIMPEKFSSPQLREFYRSLAANLASGLGVKLYTVPGIKELKKLLEQRNITHVFTGAEEYTDELDYFEQLTKEGYIVTIAAPDDLRIAEDSKVILTAKPVSGNSIVNILNGETPEYGLISVESPRHPKFQGIRALVVDDEPMNLVVATGLFKEYGMMIDTALSGKESIKKYTDNDYDVVFMDHMMPEMDGIEAMKRLREVASKKNKKLRIIALTANAISGARAMFLNEGFDGFISKPVDLNDFERTMNMVMSNGESDKGGKA
ncbi:MAG: response regulator [Butyrivibrio sp.]|nr:response regulator [Butyrivibrio sp.]